MTAGCDGSISNKGCIVVVKVHFGELDTIIKQDRKELGSMKCIQGRVQIIDRGEIECQLVHSHDMLIDAREKILLPRKYHRETTDVNLSQSRFIARDGVIGIGFVGDRQVISFHANGIQAGPVQQI